MTYCKVAKTGLEEFCVFVADFAVLGSALFRVA
jgi:hypothetical protein